MSRVWVQLGMAAVSIAVSFLASVWVNAMSRLTSARAKRLEDEQPKRGKLLVQIAETPRPYLTSALLLMLAARVSAAVIVAGVLVRVRVPLAEVIAVAVMTFVLFELAEIAPRNWVLERPDQVMLASARPVWWLGRALRPLSSFLIAINRVFLLILPGRGLPKGPLTSEEEIMGMLEVAEEEEVIETEERQMITSIFEFGDTVVREVMVPRPDMVCVEADIPLADVLDLALKHGFSRIPVIRGDIDDILGIVYTRDVMKRLRSSSTRRARKASDVMREAAFVPESKKVSELLREMQRSKTHLAIVVDEYGGTAGLVTLEDLLEEIVGEIVDEYDREEPDVQRVDDGTLRVRARLDIDELNDLLGVELPNSEWDSVGGLVAGTLGRVPSEGDRVVVEGIEFVVEKMRGRRIHKVLVHRCGDEADAAAEG